MEWHLAACVAWGRAAGQPASRSMSGNAGGGELVGVVDPIDLDEGHPPIWVPAADFLPGQRVREMSRHGQARGWSARPRRVKFWARVQDGSLAGARAHADRL